MTSYGTVWKLRVDPYSRELGGFFVMLSAQRSDFYPKTVNRTFGRSFVFEDVKSSTDAGLFVFSEYAGERDILIPAKKTMGCCLAGPEDLLAEGRTAVAFDRWNAYLRKFQPWIRLDGLTERARYVVEVIKEKEEWKVTSSGPEV